MASITRWFQFQGNQLSFRTKQYSFHVGLCNFNSQFVCFLRLRNNINEFLFRAKPIYSQFVKRCYLQRLFRCLTNFVWLTCITLVTNTERNRRFTISDMVNYSPSVTCNRNDGMEINLVIKACTVKFYLCNRWLWESVDKEKPLRPNDEIKILPFLSTPQR